MRFLPALAALSGTVLLVSCGRRAADEAEIEKRVQERLAEEHQALAQQELRDRQAALDAREQELKQREQQAEQTAAQPADIPPERASIPLAPADSVQSFYDALAPYGQWIEMPNYGYVWQPQDTVHNANWRPYTNGHWAYTDYGWTWISSEPYGWITYHYGRWMRTHQLRWIWVPGEQWAPAWVSWRYGNGYVGWAPLPPEAQFDGPGGIQQWADTRYQLGASDYTFVPASEFGEDSMAAVSLPPEQVPLVYDDSTNVTDIVYESPTVIFCYGPNWDFIRQKSRRPPQRLRINRNGFGGRNGAVVSNGTLEITAPVIKKGASKATPPVVRGRFNDSRVVTITPTRAPRPASSPEAAAAYRPPTPVSETSPGAPNGYVSRPVLAAPYAAGPAPTGLHYPTRMSPAPVPAAIVEQKAQQARVLEGRPAATPLVHAEANSQAAERARLEEIAAEKRQEQQQAAEQERARKQAAAEKAEAEIAAAARAKAAQAQEAAARQVQSTVMPAPSPVPLNGAGAVRTPH